MIAPYFDVAGAVGVRIVKLSQPVVNRRIGDVDLSKGLIFPKLFSIAEFDKGELVFQIVIQGALK
jgi:hypothetical protein